MKEEMLNKQKGQATAQSLSMTVGETTGEKIFSMEEAAEIAYEAELAQEIEEKRKSNERGRRVLEIIARGTEQSPTSGGLSVSDIYELAQGVNKEYVDKILKLKYPSREQQLRDIKEYCAFPSSELVKKRRDERIKRAADKYKEILFDLLMVTFPEREFVCKSKSGYYRDYDDHLSHYLSIYEIAKEKNIEKSFFKRIFHKNKNLLAKSRIYYDAVEQACVRMDIYHPSFLSACGKQLRVLKKELDLGCELIYHYEIK